MAAETVSVIVPCFNSALYLRETLDSLLAQTHRPIEVVVCDDGSTDDSAAIAEGYGAPVQVVRRDRRGGVSAARNTGIAHSRGEWIALCDADDYWDPTKLEEQLAIAATDPTIDLVFTHVREFLSPEIDPATMTTRPPREVAIGPLPSAMLMRRTLFEAAGEFRLDVGRGDFIEWYPRAVDAGAHEATVPETLTHRRHHHSNNSNSTDDGSNYVRAMHAHLARRRGER